MSWDLCRVAGELHMKAFPTMDLAKLELQNIPFTKPNPACIWYRFVIIPADSWSPIGDSASRRYRGLFQATVFAPGGGGIAALTQEVDAIVAHFDRKRLVQGGVTLDTEVPTPGPYIQETGWTSIPISIAFETV